MKYTVTVTDENGKPVYARELDAQLIRNVAHFVEGLISTAVMFNDYGDGFTDLDMCREINGHFLNIEFKNDLTDVVKNWGQLALAVNMAKTSKFTTFFVEGTPENPKRMFSVSHFKPLERARIINLKGVDDLKYRIAQWERLARRAPLYRYGEKWSDVQRLCEVLAAQMPGMTIPFQKEESA